MDDGILGVDSPKKFMELLEKFGYRIGQAKDQEYAEAIEAAKARYAAQGKTYKGKLFRDPGQVMDRTAFEVSGAAMQCISTIGKCVSPPDAPNPVCRCWLCGLPVYQADQTAEDAGMVTSGSSGGVEEFLADPASNPQCEHLLPLLPTFMILGGIYDVTLNPEWGQALVDDDQKKQLISVDSSGELLAKNERLRTVQEASLGWAHALCNIKKSNKVFVTYTDADKSTIKADDNAINDYLDKLSSDFQARGITFIKPGWKAARMASINKTLKPVIDYYNAEFGSSFGKLGMLASVATAVGLVLDNARRGGNNRWSRVIQIVQELKNVPVPPLGAAERPGGPAPALSRGGLCDFESSVPNYLAIQMANAQADDNLCGFIQEVSNFPAFYIKLALSEPGMNLNEEIVTRFKQQCAEVLEAGKTSKDICRVFAKLLFRHMYRDLTPGMNATLQIMVTDMNEKLRKTYKDLLPATFDPDICVYVSAVLRSILLADLQGNMKKAEEEAGLLTRLEARKAFRQSFLEKVKAVTKELAGQKNAFVTRYRHIANFQAELDEYMAEIMKYFETHSTPMPLDSLLNFYSVYNQISGFQIAMEKTIAPQATADDDDIAPQATEDDDIAMAAATQPMKRKRESDPGELLFSGKPRHGGNKKKKKTKKHRKYKKFNKSIKKKVKKQITQTKRSRKSKSKRGKKRESRKNRK